VIATLGYAAVVTALFAAGSIAFLGARSAMRREPANLVVPVAVLAGASLASFVLLEIAILTHDF
jgi:hypothetical protein